MRFLADMGVSQRTVKWLREQGHDAVHLREQGLQRMHDSDILEKAREKNRIILTMDLDFGALLAANRGALPSVTIFRLENETSDSVNGHLSSILGQYSQQLEAGVLLSVRDNLVRVRILPISSG